MRKILLTQSKYALVDDEDYELVSKYKWFLQTSPAGYDYAVRSRGRISMHRLIMKPPKNMVVDHINRDGLDNRRSNMRVVSHSINHHNSPKTAKGWVCVNGRYKARIRIEGKIISLGSFGTAEEAEEAYKKAKQIVMENLA